MLTDQYKESSLESSNTYINRNNDFWENVVFSDEETFQASHKSFSKKWTVSVSVWEWLSASG